MLCGLFFVFGSIFYLIDLATHPGTIARNVSVGRVDVGNMTRDEAVAAVSAETVSLLSEPIDVVANGQDVEIQPSDVAATVDVAVDVEAAFRTRARANPISWLASFVTHESVGIDSLTVTESMVGAILKPHFAGMETTAVDATWDVDGETATVVAAQSGVGLDISSATKGIERAILAMSGERTTDVPLEVLEPSRTTEMAEAMGIKEKLASFTTKFPSGQSRAKNIERVSELVSGTVVEPNGHFSINEAGGQRTKETGFVEGGVIKDGKSDTAIGGGVSQYSTTMFNAAYFAGVPITDFKAHSFYISRYPIGREATLWYPSIDLAFDNDYTTYMLVDSTVGPSSVTVTLYGTDDGRVVSTETTDRSDTTAPKVRCALDSELEPGTEKAIQSSLPGFSVRTTRTITRADGSQVPWTFTTVYKPKNQIVEYNPVPTTEPSGNEAGNEADSETDADDGSAPDENPPLETDATPPAEPMKCPAANDDVIN